MSTILDIREKKGQGERVSFGQSQQALADLPASMRTLTKSVQSVRRMLEQGREVSAGTLDVLAETCVWVERIYDRLDDLTAEQRVTNQLLAELVAVQKSVIQDDVRVERDSALAEARHRALGGL